MSLPTALRPSAAHTRRLRAVWRSAGWPCHDVIEAELLLAGLLQRQHDEQGRDRLLLTDAGLAAITAAVQRHRQARSAHDNLVEQVARAMQRAGRLAWRGLSLRAPLPGVDGSTVWHTAMPDVFSIRHTTLEDAVEPLVHEVKVHRADLLSDLRHEAKREAYRALSSQCWYVLRAGIAQPEEVPPQYGVLLAHFSHTGAGPGVGASATLDDETDAETGLRAGAVAGVNAGAGSSVSLEVARPAPHRALRLPLATWMALAKATPEPPLDEDAQPGLQAPAASAPT